MKLVFPATTLVLLFACSSTTTGADAGATERPSCEMLAEHCHDATSDDGKKCHDLGHEASSTEEACRASADRCMTFCAHADAGTDAEVTSDAGADAPADVSSCKAVGAVCADNAECCTGDCHAHGGPKMCE